MKNKRKVGIKGMTNPFKLASMIALLGLSPGVQSTPIDLFTTQQINVDDTLGNGGVETSVGDGSDATILGGSRDIYLEKTLGNLFAYLFVFDGAGNLSFNTDSGVAATGYVQWDGADFSINLDPTGLGGVDLTQNSAEAFQISLDSADLDYKYIVGVYTDATHWTTIELSRNAHATPLIEVLEFSIFENAALCGVTVPAANINVIDCGMGGPVDTENVGAIEIVFNPGAEIPALDMTISGFQTISTVDCTGKLGDRVWFDENRNGIQDAGEHGIEAVTVNLKDSSGNIITSDVTDASGLYEFTELCADDYIVEVDTSTLPADYVASPTEQGADNTVDSNVNGALITLPSDTHEDVTIDFGYNSPCTGKIGNYVWFDENRNGIQDAGEAGIEGVKVILKDDQNTEITFVTTDADGYYEFDGLCADDYIVEVDTSTLPADYVASPTEEGADNTVDSNVNGALITLPSDTHEDVSIDFGYNSPCTGKIGNYVWFDANRNGIQDAGESGIEGVKVILKDDQNTEITFVTTDADGYYEFDGLCADDYIVEVDTSTLPAGYVASSTEQGVDNTVDSNVNGALITLPSDTHEDVTIDFGYNSPCTGKIGNYVWFDENRNGIQDAGEAGIEGVKVILKDDQNTEITFVTTDADGYYEFDGLCADDYIVEVDTSTLPADYVASPTEQGVDNTVDSNVNGALITLPSDTHEDVTIDFGYNSPCTGKIGNYVWFDENRNGIQDAGEAGIEGVKVILKDDQNTEITFVTTDADGYYEFDGLCADDYIVEVDTSTLPADYVASPTEEGADNTVDSNVNGALITLPSDTHEDVTIDFGYNSPCTGKIGNYVWFDENRNGIQDAGEAGIEGVKVILKDDQNTEITFVTTDADGYYEFDGLCADDYIVEVDTSTLPADYVASPTEQGVDNTVDSNVNGALITLPSDTHENETIDFGYNSPCTGKIGNYVWFDENRNGIQDAGEAGIEGVKVILEDDQNTEITFVTTDADGYYEFDGLCAGSYKVEVDTSTVPADYVASPTEEGGDLTKDSNPNGDTVVLDNDNDVDETIDFAYNSPCTGMIGNYVWYDANRNGIQDNGEEGIVGIRVHLKDANNNILDTVTTVANGYYQFDGLCAGDYRVEVVTSDLPPEYVASPTLTGSDRGLDSNVNNDLVNLPADDSVDESIDFAYNSPCTGVIGNYVWLDDDKNGLQDTLNELGIADVKVILKDAANTVLAETMTDSNGFYQFPGLCAGDYIVEVDPTTLPLDVSATDSQVGLDGSIDSNGSPSNVVLPDDFASDMTIDFGYIENILENCEECDGKVTELTMKYTGSVAAQVIVEQKKGGEVFNMLLQPGQVFTFSGTEKHGTLGTEITFIVDGNEQAKLHTSCSVEIGPGTVAGSFVVVEGYSRNGGLMCPVDNPPAPGDCSECDGKVTQLTLQYNGSVAAQVAVEQKKKGVIFDQLVQPGESFTISGVDKKGTLGTEITFIVDGAEQAKLHTSCSQEIGPGTVAGDFLVTEAYSRNGGLMCPVDVTPPGPGPGPGDDCSECDGKVTQLTLQYNGSVAAQVAVEQKKKGVIFDQLVQPGESFTINGVDKKGTLGTEITFIVDGAEQAKLHTSCSQEIGSGTVVGDFLVTEAYSRNGGLMCPVDVTPPGPGPGDDCSECDGKVTQLTLQYNGSVAAQVAVEQKKKGVIFDQLLQPGESFTINGVDKKGTLGTEITFIVDGAEQAKLHTSCSQEIGPGTVAADFLVTEAYSRNGGLMCAI